MVFAIVFLSRLWVQTRTLTRTRVRIRTLTRTRVRTRTPTRSAPKGVGALLLWVGLLVCVGWNPLLWRGWLKIFKTTPKGVGALLLRVGLLFLCRLECPLVERVAKDF
jgi:hypothetical protein